MTLADVSLKDMFLWLRFANDLLIERRPSVCDKVVSLSLCVCATEWAGGLLEQAQ